MSTHPPPPGPPNGPFGDDYNDYDDYGYDDYGYDDYQGDEPIGIGRHLDRRRFLQLLLASGAVASGAGVMYSGRERVAQPTVAQPSTQLGVVTRPNASPETVGNLLEDADGNRVLVLIELEGGNDGPSMVVPYGSGAYYDLRPNIAIPEEEVLTLDNEVGLNPNLSRLHQRGVALVEGVGPLEGNLSHFEMVQRWDRGDIDGKGDLGSGFLARLTDTVDNKSPLVGLSVGGATPRFANSAASTLALDNPEALWYLARGDNQVLQSFHDSLGVLFRDETSMMGMVGSSWEQLLQLGATVNEQLERENDETNPMFTDGGRLGRQLSLAADLIAADVGVRVVHARIGGFDTHQGHLNRHNQLMGQLDAAVAGFLQQMDVDGAADRVLVATTSEFGRRLGENQGGTDHGSGSVMLVAGPVAPGRYGLASSLTDLDDSGNLRTEVPFDSYLGTLAERWLGVEAGSILPRDPELIPLI